MRTLAPVSERRCIVAMGGGGYPVEPEEPLLDRFVVELAARRRHQPTVCYLGTASGEQERFSELFRRAYARLGCRPVELSLFWREVQDLRGFLLGCDAVLVGGGNTANLLVLWRLHGLDAALRAAWEDGVVLAGWSAGMLCWFEGGVPSSWSRTLSFLQPRGMRPAYLARWPGQAVSARADARRPAPPPGTGRRRPVGERRARARLTCGAAAPPSTPATG